VHLTEVIGQGQPPEVPAQDSFETMLCGFAAEVSEREHRIVKLAELR
jgi:hypothetical protein